MVIHTQFQHVIVETSVPSPSCAPASSDAYQYLQVDEYWMNVFTGLRCFVNVDIKMFQYMIILNYDNGRAYSCIRTNSQQSSIKLAWCLPSTLTSLERRHLLRYLFTELTACVSRGGDRALQFFNIFISYCWKGDGINWCIFWCVLSPLVGWLYVHQI